MLSKYLPCTGQPGPIQAEPTYTGWACVVAAEPSNTPARTIDVLKIISASPEGTIDFAFSSVKTNLGFHLFPAFLRSRRKSPICHIPLVCYSPCGGSKRDVLYVRSGDLLGFCGAPPAERTRFCRRLGGNVLRQLPLKVLAITRNQVNYPRPYPPSFPMRGRTTDNSGIL